MPERVVDLRSYTTLCGDPSVHILEALEEAGDETVRVIASAKEAEEVRRAVVSLVAAGLAEKIGEEKRGDELHILLRRAG
jgi:hypothetical protein